MLHLQVSTLSAQLTQLQHARADAAVRAAQLATLHRKRAHVVQVESRIHELMILMQQAKQQQDERPMATIEPFKVYHF
jgi:hypothetical protein